MVAGGSVAFRSWSFVCAVPDSSMRVRSTGREHCTTVLRTGLDFIPSTQLRAGANYDIKYRMGRDAECEE